MAAHPEQNVESSAAHRPVTWISREHAAIECIPEMDRADVSQPTTTPLRNPRLAWVMAAGAISVAAAVGFIVWKGRATPAVAPPALASHESIPLVSILSPGLTPVTTNVTFTGAIFARFDMPIGVDGDAGRIVALYAEAGDHVKRG